MNLQSVLANVLTNLRKPGFIKSTAGQLLTIYGSQLAVEAATEANDRYEEAALALEAVKRQLADRGPALRNTAVEMIRAGVLDDEVERRAGVLAQGRAGEDAQMAQLVDDEDGPPETAGAVRDLPGDEPRPPCVDPTCCLDYAHAGPHRPAIPPRMAGGFLSVVPGVPIGPCPHGLPGDCQICRANARVAARVEASRVEAARGQVDEADGADRDDD